MKHHIAEFEKHLAESRKKNKESLLSTNTVNAYIADVTQFLEFIDYKDDNLTSEKVEEFKKILKEGSDYLAKTINRKLVAVKKFIEYLNNQVYTSKISITIAFIEYQTQSFLENELKINEYNRMIDEAEKRKDKRSIALFSALFKTGTRISELLQMRVKHVDKGNYEVIGKGAKCRKIRIHQSLQEILFDYIRERKYTKDEFVFKNANENKPITRQTAHKIIFRYGGHANIPKNKRHAHNFRHLYAIEMIKRGADAAELQSALGHSDINTTAIYFRKSEKDYTKKEETL